MVFLAPPPERGVAGGGDGCAIRSRPNANKKGARASTGARASVRFAEFSSWSPYAGDPRDERPPAVERERHALARMLAFGEPMERGVIGGRPTLRVQAYRPPSNHERRQGGRRPTVPTSGSAAGTPPVPPQGQPGCPSLGKTAVTIGPEGRKHHFESARPAYRTKASRMPPSTAIMAPVVREERSVARKRTASATSSARTSTPSRLRLR